MTLRHRRVRGRRPRNDTKVVAIATVRRQRLMGRAAMVAATVLLAVASGLLVGFYWSGQTARAEEPAIAVCGVIRDTCVVDGDTLWVDGVKIRIADIDTPEISSPGCDQEYALGIRARDRLVALLNEGPVELVGTGDRDEDRYGRKLRVLVQGGISLGDRLVGEGLARTWTGRRQGWC